MYSILKNVNFTPIELQVCNTSNIYVLVFKKNIIKYNKLRTYLLINRIERHNNIE